MALTAERRQKLATAASFVVVAAAIVGVLVVRATPDREDPSQPTAWDPRVVDLVAFVEEHRGLRFEHPIEMAFLSDEAFRDAVSPPPPPRTPADDMADREFAGVVRALGLAEGELDMQAAYSRLDTESVTGLYDPFTDSIAMRGDVLTDQMRPVVVHELTHALQAQHFEIAPEIETSGEQLAFQTLIEADAIRMEDAYLATLTAAERDAYYETGAELVDQRDLDGVPPYLDELASVPYVLGPRWLDAVLRARGVDALDDLFDEPPVTEEQILLPERYLDGDDAEIVNEPVLRQGEDDGTYPDSFGMLFLFIVLGERVPFEMAWRAVQGWEGDSWVTFHSAGRVCVKLRVDTEEPEPLREAMRAWIGEGDASDTALRYLAESEEVELRACDPGEDFRPSPRPGPRAYDQLLEHLYGAAPTAGTAP